MKNEIEPTKSEPNEPTNELSYLKDFFDNKHGIIKHKLYVEENAHNIDFDLLKGSFQKEWIDELSKVVTDYVISSESITDNNKYFFFGKLGKKKRNDQTTKKEISDYFNRLLYAPNIAILDYVIKNYEKLKSFKFIDNGAGLGILSIFLKKLNIDCYNYDNFTQLNNVTMHENIYNSMGMTINPVRNEINLECNILISAGMWIDNQIFKDMDLKFILADSNWIDKGITNELVRGYKISEVYSTIIAFEKQ